MPTVSCQQLPRNTVTRRLTHEQFLWQPTTLLVFIRRYRRAACAHVWFQETNATVDSRAKISHAGLRLALVETVVGHLSMARVTEVPESAVEHGQRRGSARGVTTADR